MITVEMQGKIELFSSYMVTNEIGDWVGIKDNAPTDAKRAYKEFLAEQKEAHKKGKKV